MKINKSGGASVKDAEGVKNVLRILETIGSRETLIVISAMGKTTNALETVVNDYLRGSSFRSSLQPVKETHEKILLELFDNKKAPVFSRVKDLFVDLENFFKYNKSSKYDFVYDQVVSYGELISTTIVNEYLHHCGVENEWLDARDVIRTNGTYRDAEVQWEETQEAVIQRISKDSCTIHAGVYLCRSK